MSLELQMDSSGFEAYFQRAQQENLLHLVPWVSPSFRDVCETMEQIFLKRESLPGAVVQLLGVDGQLMVTGPSLNTIQSEADLSAYVERLSYVLHG